MLVALLVCLIPTTIGALLSAIGIAGMDRLVQRNVLAMSGRAVEAAGDVDTLLLDKTGTITLGNRQAAEFIPVARRRPSDELADAAQLSQPRRRDARGPLDRRARQASGYGLRDGRDEPRGADARAVHRPDPDERRRPARRPASVRKGAADSVAAWSSSAAARCRPSSSALVDGDLPRRAARRSSSPSATGDGAARCSA